MDNKNDSYEELLRQLNGDSGVPFSKKDSEVKNNGEIYFSPNSPNRSSRPATSQTNKSRDGISFSGNGDSSQRISQPRSTSGTAGSTRPVRAPETRTTRSSDTAGSTRPVRTPETRTARSTDATRPVSRPASTTAARPQGTLTQRKTRESATEDGVKRVGKTAAAAAAAKTAAGARKNSDEKKRKLKKKSDKTGTAGTPETQQNGKKKTKKKKGKKISAFTIKLVACILTMVLLAFLIRIPIISCVNDVLALDGTNTAHRVTLTETMECNEVIDLLGEKNLISNPWFCKIVAKFMDFDEYTNSDGEKEKIVYPAGDYDLSTDMGIEGMLTLIESAGNEDSTVSITFPEGYTVDQIAEKLELNGVCSKNSFYQALATDKIYEQYDFLSGLDRTTRYRAIEGYLYPDTYEFYVGEDPYSVLSRFLDNFEAKWTDEYEARCEKRGYTMDEIITVASILEKEAADSEQMPLIASIIYNRLASPGLYPFINCDSTAKYIENAKDTINDDNAYNAYLLNYDTYQHNGLPVGAICNPGEDAIYAALYPDSTSYYYFLHDKDGKIYVAKTASEHEANGQYIDE